MLGGTGPTTHLQTVLDGISDMLSANNVKVKIASGEAKSRNVLLDEMKASGATLLLYIEVHQESKKPGVGGGGRGSIVARSFVDGKPMWEEEVKGGIFAGSAEAEVRKMLKNINDKLKAHIGSAGLPKV
jgi:hypothetical protein